MIIYWALFLSWQYHNSWETSAWFAVLFLLGNLIYICSVYRRFPETFITRRHIPSWDFLIVFLMIAVGFAGGSMMFMSFGWTALGVVLFRPLIQTEARPEWFKLCVPVLFSLPFWLDYSGSSIAAFDGLLSTGSETFIGQTLFSPIFGHSSEFADSILLRNQLPAILYCCVLVLCRWVPGKLFWIFIPLLGTCFFLINLMAVLPESASTGLWLAQWKHLIGMPLCIGSMVWFTLQQPRLPQSLYQSSQAVSIQLERRVNSPWMAGIVILSHQVSFFFSREQPMHPIFQFSAFTLFLLTLGWIRYHRPLTRQNDAEMVWLVIALFLLLAGEWIDWDLLRHLSLGCLLVSLTTWKRSFPHWKVFFISIAWILLMPATQLFFNNMDLLGKWIPWLQTIASGAFLLAVLPGTNHRTQKKPPKPREFSMDWQPLKRFAFIMLFLLIGFQNLSHYEEQTRGTFASPPNPTIATSQVKRKPELQIERTRIGHEDGIVHSFRQRSGSNHLKIVAIEKIIRNAGWKIENKVTQDKNLNRYVAMDLLTDSGKMHLVYWFEHNNISFTSYRRARRIVWSGWHHNHEHLELNVLFSQTVSRADLSRMVSSSRG
ncbi:MAG TPA: hypothetical protein EYQ50_28940 [Verrucomicrobiales bacterium]|nr:hypothetical protein [Verrucomicrobiales bacterium]HIL69231.1 hypothetical protein [Verrucomicrobiota bacterium]